MPSPRTLIALVLARPGAPSTNKWPSEAFAAAEAKLSAGLASAESVYLWSTRWLGAVQEARPAEAAAALSAHHARMTALHAALADRVAQGAAAPADLAATRYYVAEAAVWVASP